MALAAVIQERRRAEKAARQNEEHLAMAMNAAQMGTWEWNIADNTAKWSDETKRIFGRSPTDPEGTNEEFYSWIHPDDRLFVEQAINRAVNEGSPYEAEFRMLQPDGSIRWVRGKGKVLRDEAGKPQRMIGLNADITEQKRGAGGFATKRSAAGARRSFLAGDADARRPGRQVVESSADVV